MPLCVYVIVCLPIYSYYNGLHLVPCMLSDSINICTRDTSYINTYCVYNHGHVSLLRLTILGSDKHEPSDSYVFSLTCIWEYLILRDLLIPVSLLVELACLGVLSSHMAYLAPFKPLIHIWCVISKAELNKPGIGSYAISHFGSPGCCLSFPFEEWRYWLWIQYSENTWYLRALNACLPGLISTLGSCGIMTTLVVLDYRQQLSSEILPT